MCLDHKVTVITNQNEALINFVTQGDLAREFFPRKV